MLRLLAAALAVLPLGALAQDDPAFRVDGDETVVTAGRLADDARETGRHVSVITAADIARSPAQSLDELLRVEAGVLVTPRGAFGAQADLSIRGGTFNGVVVLVDGARFNDPMTGHFLSDFPIPLGEIARVEVLRGPDAAAWGPDALGGVIHVITHTGARRVEGRRGRGTVEAALGANGTRRTEVDRAPPHAARRVQLRVQRHLDGRRANPRRRRRAGHGLRRGRPDRLRPRGPDALARARAAARTR